MFCTEYFYVREICNGFAATVAEGKDIIVCVRARCNESLVVSFVMAVYIEIFNFYNSVLTFVESEE